MIISCPICSDSFNPSSNLVNTPCGHIFHYECMIQWFERSKSCPQCRKPAQEQKLVKIYLNVTSTGDSQEDPARLNEVIDNLQLTIRGKDKEINEFKSKTVDLRNSIEVLRVENTNLSDNNVALESQVSALRRCVRSSKTLEADLKNMRQQKDKAVRELQALKSANTILHGTVSEAEEAMMQNCDGSESSKSLITISSALKRELVTMDEKLRTSRKELERQRTAQQSAKLELKKQHQEQVDQLHGEIEILRSENINLKKKLKKMQDTLVSPGPGNAKDKILNRLLHESPMPEEFRRPLKRELLATQAESPEVIVLSSPEFNASNKKKIFTDDMILGAEQQKVVKKDLTSTKSVPTCTVTSRQPLVAKNSFSKLGLGKNLSGSNLVTRKKSSAPSSGMTTFQKSTSSLFEPTRTSKIGGGGDALYKRLYAASHAPAAGMVYNGLGGTVKADQTIKPKKISSLQK